MRLMAWDRHWGREVEVLKMDFKEWWLQVRNPISGYEDGDRCSFNNEETDRFILKFKITPIGDDV